MDLGLRFKQYQEYLTQANGKRLDQEIIEVLQNIDLSDWKGRFLQIGAVGQASWYQSLNFAARYKLSPVEIEGADFVASPHEIPLISKSIDVLYAPFIFDLGLEPKAFIDEADRVLASMGLMILIGLNPTSLWRISRFFSCTKRNWYQSATGCSAWYLRHLFHQLDYEVVDMEFFYFVPPFKNSKLIRYFSWVNRISKYMAFYPPSLYILVVQKKDQAFNGLLAVEKSPLC
jgi:hypothetical protein